MSQGEAELNNLMLVSKLKSVRLRRAKTISSYETWANKQLRHLIEMAIKTITLGQKKNP
jgi:hypothetical protein